MPSFTAFDAYDPDHLAWLHTRHRFKKPVEATDLARLIRANPGTVTDPLLRDYVCRALEGQLKKNRGRPAVTFEHEVRLLQAGFRVERLAARIRQMRKGRVSSSVRSSADFSPMELAAEHVARRMKLGAGTTLLKDISRQKSRGIFGR